MGLFTDGDGIPLAFSLFPGSQNEQKSLKPLETKILQQFDVKNLFIAAMPVWLLRITVTSIISVNVHLLSHSRSKSFRQKIGNGRWTGKDSNV